MLNWNDDREIIFFLGDNRYFRLRWNSSDYGDIDHIYINRGEIWCPEITVVSAYDFINVHINSGDCLNLTSNFNFNFTTLHLSLQISGESRLKIFFGVHCNRCKKFLTSHHITLFEVDYRLGLNWLTTVQIMSNLQRYKLISDVIFRRKEYCFQLSSDGSVMFLYTATMGVNCPLTLNDFPFDYQKVNVRLMSTTSSIYEYRIKALEYPKMDALVSSVTTVRKLKQLSKDTWN